MRGNIKCLAMNQQFINIEKKEVEDKEKEIALKKEEIEGKKAKIAALRNGADLMKDLLT